MPAPSDLLARVRALRPASIAGALVLTVAIACGLYAVLRGGWVSTDDAFVEGTMSFLAAEIPGRVQEVAVDQHQAVHEGDLLVRLDPSDYEARVARARADLADARNRMRAAEAAAGSAEAERRANEVELWRTGRELERVSTLFQGDAASRQRLEQASAARDSAAARSRALELRAESEAAMLGDDAPLHQAEAALREAELALAHTEIRAPFDGVVGPQERRARARSSLRASRCSPSPAPGGAG